MKLVLGKSAVDRVAAGVAPEVAAAEAIAHLVNRLGGHGGIILLGPDGRIGLAHNTITKGMSVYCLASAAKA